jgi:alkylation response protein AidB-like acyl-CoA dehydrogenase
MDLSLSDEQRLLGEAASRFIAGRYSFEQRRAILQSSDGFSREIWREMADLGWLGLPFAEDFGGLGAGPVEIGIVMEAIGRALIVEPYLSTIVLSGSLISALATPEQKSALLPKIAEGKELVALAHSEPQARFALADVATMATEAGNSWHLSGRKEVVIGAPAADWLLVSARISGGQRDPKGIGVFLVSASANGLSRKDFPTLDGGRASNLELDEVKVESNALLGLSHDALPAISEATDRAIAAVCTEAIGCMEVLLETTIAYTKTRVQFGAPLAANQVLRHRMVDMAVKIEEAKASSLKCTLSIDADPVTRARAASSAKAKVGRCGRYVAEQAVQLHGGMGVTEELNVNAYFKRLLAIEVLFGSPDFHLRRHAKLAREETA